MNCENKFCIYQKEDCCLLEKISINTLGMCEDCIIINLNEESLQKEKEELFRKFDLYWQEIGN